MYTHWMTSTVHVANFLSNALHKYFYIFTEAALLAHHPLHGTNDTVNSNDRFPSDLPSINRRAKPRLSVINPSNYLSSPHPSFSFDLHKTGGLTRLVTMASRGALKSTMRMAGQRATALSPPSAHVGIRATSLSAFDGHGTGAGWLAADQPVRWANLKAISDRMRSVGSVGKITKAMKMVAAAKLRSVQVLQENSRPFAIGLQNFFSTMDDFDASVKSTVGETAPKHSRFVVAVTSDRGLCGGVNSSIVRRVKAMFANDKESDNAIMLIGDKGRDGLTRANGKNIIVSFKDVFKAPVSFAQVCLIAEDILSRDYDEIVLVYNKYKSVLSQEVTEKPIVGLKALMDGAEAFDEYEFDSDMDSAQVLVDLFEFQLATQIFNALLENATSEQAARMSAMDSASRNATDMLKTLKLTYNRQRQAAITQELSEITSGAAALE